MSDFIGFIGGGNMGGAIAEAVCRNGNEKQVAVYDPDQNKLEALCGKIGCYAAQSGDEVIAACRFVLLAVKPQIFDDVVRGLLPALQRCAEHGEDRVIVSIAAGITLEHIESLLREAKLEFPVVRAMPNTPVAVGQGLVLLCPNKHVTDEAFAALTALLSGCGLVERATEHEIELGMSVFSCSPAFSYLFIEAMADGAVQLGLPRGKAQRFAAQAVLGAAAMVLGTGKHPGQLKDEVCSPGGYTIRGVHALEQAGFRAAAAEAVLVASGLV